MTIHYHGTPLSPRSELYKLAGKHFCVPFSHDQDAVTCLAIAQSVMFDNGAFSIHTKGGKLDVAAYYAWLESKIAHPHWAVVPDEIDGSIEKQKIMTATWPFPVAFGAPVWHMGLSIDYLLELSDNWPRICFGSTAMYCQVGSDDWARRCDQAFDALVSTRRFLPWIHMLRGLALCGARWPFASADSVNVARNYKDTNTCPERMARRIDAVQCPNRWVPQLKQQGLFA